MLRCSVCGLVQLSVVVDPERLFRSYLYASSASPPLHAHFSAYAQALVPGIAPLGSLVVEIGSNDGVLLGPLRDRGVRVLGVEPATDLARGANAAGLETLNDFFTPDLARRIAADRGRAAAVVANNVLAHIDDLAGVMAGLDELLAPEGAFVAEVPYLADLLERVEYDTIYHEHLSYFALEPLRRLFEDHGLELLDVARLPVHGGSLRVVAGRRGGRARSSAVDAALRSERDLELADPRTYLAFAQRVRDSRDALLAMIRGIRDDGRSVAALGATAKGNTLLNYCGIGPDLVAYVADSTPAKQGMLTPGMRIPVVEEAAIERRRPDFTLLLAWNYADSILGRFAPYVAAGGRFIHPIPVARMLP